tara:strand:+ start:1926 stop:2408 length:483 start_codon:yes stop_codon:yes gene_type:complete
MSKNKYETDEGYELFVAPLEAYMKENPAETEEDIDTYEYTQNTINRGRKFAKHRLTSFDTLYSEWHKMNFEGWPLKKLDDETTKQIKKDADSMDSMNEKYWNALPIKPTFKVKGKEYIDASGKSYAVRMNEKNIKNWTMQAKDNGSLWRDQSQIPKRGVE